MNFLSVFVFGYFTGKMRGPPAYSLLFPVGAVIGAYIFTRAVVRWRRVEWKGREYLLLPLSECG